jgi:hypothetical protein
MMFGDKEKFAIEIEIPPEARSGPWGQARLWISGQVLGDYSYVCLLTGFVATVASWAQSWSSKTDDELASLDGEELHARLEALPHGTLTAARERDAALRRVVFCPNETEAFDGDRVYVVPSSGIDATLSYRPFRSKTFASIRLPSRVVRDALQECDDWLRNLPQS